MTISNIESLREEILAHAWETPHFDVHSHFCQEGGPVGSVDGYVGAWTQPEVLPAGLSDEEAYRWRRSRWEMKRSYWISRAFPPALEHLYGTADKGEMAAEMNRLRERGLVASIDWVMARSNVECVVVDSNPQLASSNEGILSTYRLEPPALFEGACDLEVRIDQIEEEVRSWMTKGGVHCFKVPSAYFRTLLIEDAPASRALRAASKAMAKRDPAEERALEDYVFRHFFGRASEWGLPVEIHTGFGWAIGKRPLRLSEADPENLLPILEDPGFSSTTFVLFHGGYPFTSKMGYIAGAFPNVYLDFTCLCPESWSMLKRALHEWIDIVPMDRIVTGSDGSYEWMFFAAKYNRECLAQVLTEKVAGEHMDMDLAKEVLDRVLSLNGRTVFGRA